MYKPFMLVLFILVISCSKKEYYPIKALENEFIKTIPKEVPKKISVIADITASMKGYHGVKHFNQFLNNLNTEFRKDDINVNYYALGKSLELVCNENTTDDKFNLFLKDEMYNENATDITKLKEKIHNDSSVIIFLTDMQTNGEAQFRENIVQFHEFYSNKYLIKLYITKQFFDGNIWYNKIDNNGIVEKKETRLRYKGKRPYYICIISKSLKHEKYFDEIFNAFLKENLKSLSLVKTNSTNTKFILKGCKSKSDNLYYYKFYKENNNLLHFRLKKPDLFNSHIVIQNDLFKQWNTIEKENIDAKFYCFKTKKDNKGIFEDLEDSPTDIKFTIDSIKINEELLSFDITSEKEISKPGIIKITILPQVLPNWLNEFDCKASDDEEVVKKKTVDLKRFINGILSLDFNSPDREEFILSKSYIFIDRVE